MFKKILIANRGEIACRIIRTAKKLNIATVAIYSEIDEHSLHTKLADESYCIGPAASQHSYLNQNKIIEIAKRTHTEAIHPGYGFLSENSIFAQRCIDEGIIFIGPTPKAIEQMGNKSLAKAMMIAANVPVVPGYHDKNFDIKILRKEADKIGYPILIKASAGGGGKGMRLVFAADELAEAVASAQREAKSSFGDESVFLEKYIQNSRHVEVQVFADSFGSVVHLFDRDCSIQRRHQKIIEEAPAPHLSDETRKKMTTAAVNAAKAIDYLGAGTIEFIVASDESFYFMEMNTRLQVEHPVTEMITGLDLVEWQLRVAAGEKLPCMQEQIKKNGHAFEARICAENPFDQFKPSIGKIQIFVPPALTDTIRVETGMVQGDTISPHYDPMIAKIIVWDQDRDSALKKLHDVLEQTFIAGIHTNISLLHKITEQSDFKKCHFHTEFLNIHEQQLLVEKPFPDEIMAIAAIIYYQQLCDQSLVSAKHAGNSSSPWFKCDGWRSFADKIVTLKLWNQDDLHTIQILNEANTFKVIILKNEYKIKIIEKNGYCFNVLLNNHEFNTSIFSSEDKIFIFHDAKCFTISTKQPLKNLLQKTHSNNQVVSPMPGTVTEILIQPGDSVLTGDTLIILEAMKMEHTLSAPKNGIAKDIRFQKGDLVNEGDVLVEIE